VPRAIGDDREFGRGKSALACVPFVETAFGILLVREIAETAENAR
jgi:hypothetical protein